MAVNWKSLVPHRPVQPGDPLYIDRPDVGSRRIADLVRSGQSTILVAGPLGIGKSTELAQAARLLQSDRVACLVQLGLERSENMRRVTGDQVLLRIAGRLACLAIEDLGLDLSVVLREALVSRGVLAQEFLTVATGTQVHGSAAALAHATVEEVSRLSRQKVVTLLIDGLEKTPEEPVRLAFDALAELPESTEIVVVVPWHAAYGPNAQEVIRPGEKLVVLRPVEVEGAAGAPGRSFLAHILAQRLDLPVDVFDDVTSAHRVALRHQRIGLPPESVCDVVAAAATWSGGIPRTFLQLVADAASYAHLGRGAEWPDRADVDAAVRDQVESARRLLLPGDEDSLRRVDGTDGRELDLPRKLRLLQNGLLIEREANGGTMLRMHPFVRPLVADRADG